MRSSRKTRAKLAAAKSISTGGALSDSMASLCLYSEKIDIAKLTATIGCVPTYAQEKGQPRHPPHGSGPAPIGLWCLQAPDSLRFEEKIRYLLDATTSRPSTWRRLAKTHRVELRCAMFLHSWSEGFDFPASLVTELGIRQWGFGLAAYSAEGDELVEAFLSPKKSLLRRS